MEDYEYPGSFWIGLRYGGWAEKIKQLKFLDFYLYDEYRFLRFGSNSYTIHIDFYCKDYTGNELLLSQIPELKKIDEYEWTKLSLQVLGLIK